VVSIMEILKVVKSFVLMDKREKKEVFVI